MARALSLVLVLFLCVIAAPSIADSPHKSVGVETHSDLSADILNAYTSIWISDLDFHFTAVEPCASGSACCIMTPREVRLAFMDNRDSEIFSGKFGCCSTEAGMSLELCGNLRKQFLPYFTDGRFIGDRIFKSPSPDAHVSAYALPNKVLIFVMNDSGRENSFSFVFDHSSWIQRKVVAYNLSVFKEDGTDFTAPRVFLTPNSPISTRPMQNNEIYAFEVRAN